MDEKTKVHIKDITKLSRIEHGSFWHYYQFSNQEIDKLNKGKKIEIITEFENL